MTIVTKSAILLAIVAFSAIVIWLNIGSSTQHKATPSPSQLKLTLPTESEDLPHQADKFRPSEKQEAETQETYSEDTTFPEDYSKTTSFTQEGTSSESAPLASRDVNFLVENEVINEDDAQEITQLENLLKEELTWSAKE